MSETTPHKRVLPARERADSAAKRRASSPVVQPAPATEPRVKRKYTKRASLVNPATPSSNTPTRSTPFEDVLPTKVQNSKHLPTMAQKQSAKLSNREYQSIAESAILAASLHRSRMQWLCDGVFQRYWTKPVKRKGVIEQPPGNPDSKTMAKLGNATMTIKPHVFDVTFYTVKDPLSNPPSYYRHPNQHTAKQSQPPSATQPPMSIPQPNAQGAAVHTPTAVVSPNVPIPTANGTTTSTGSTHIKTETPAVQAIQQTAVPPTPVLSTPQRPIVHAPTQSVAPASASNGASKPANDPVIQMLAARAATDNRLKDLMKVVAQSQATPDQLKEFQGHIDEFNRIIKQQAAKKVEPEKTSQKSAPSAAAHPATYTGPTRPYPGPPSSIGGPMHMAPPSYTSYPQPPRAEPFIKHIVVEFHSAISVAQGASTDRWLFPEHAVLDIRSGGMEMVASFFVVRKGEDILKQRVPDTNGENSISSKFQPDIEYYQPVTISVKATQHKTIETIARAAKPLIECQTYMREIMEKKTRAPKEFLVHRLPREKVRDDTATADFIDSAIEMSNDEDDELRDVYHI